jgi:hypothetical protein
LNKALNRTKHCIEQSTESHKALNQTTENKSQKIKLAINNRHRIVEGFNKKLNCDFPILAWVKFLGDYGTDNCNPVCLIVNYEKSNGLMRASLPSQWAHA